MNEEKSPSISKKKIKQYVKDNLYISLKGILNQLTSQLENYSIRKRIINQDVLNRLIDNTFKRNLRSIHKKIQIENIDEKFWDRYQSCLQNFKKYIEDFPIGNNIEDGKKVIYKLWGGIPKFEIIDLYQKKHLIYAVFNNENQDFIIKIGYFLLSLRKRNEVSESDLENLKELTKVVYKKYKVFPSKEILYYLTPYGVNPFSFKFNQEDIIESKTELDNGDKKVLDDSNKILDSQLDLPNEEEFEWLGKLIQTQTKPMRQGKGTRRIEDIEIEGWIYESHCHLAQHNRYFIAQHPKLGFTDEKVPEGHRRRLLIKINDFKDWSQNVAHEISDDPKMGHYTQCWFNFEKFLDPDSFGSYKAVPIAGTGLDQYKIRDLSINEYHDVFDLPDTGVPLGLFLHDDDITRKGYPDNKIPFYFPVSDKNYEQLFYTPTFFVGRPGSGKTNTLKTITASSIYCNDYSSRERPAFIFFDYEGQFSSLAEPILEDVGDSEDREVWDFLKIKPVNYFDVEVFSSVSKTPTQYSFMELFKDTDIDLKIKILQYFLRNLSEVTEIAFKEISRRIFYNNDPDTYNEFRRLFINELNEPTFNVSESLAKGQRQALTRSFHDDISTFFDQPGKSFDLQSLLQPGKVLIFDLKKVSKEKVILYVLLILQKLKLEANILKNPVIVVIDEAHEIFKNVSGSSKEARYYNLISRFLAEFGSRGRKYRLGLWLASQRPQDLHKDIQKVIGTYYILGLNPEHKKWLTTALGGSKNADFILNLPNKYALFKNSSLYKGASYLLRLVKSPNIHKTFV